MEEAVGVAAAHVLKGNPPLPYAAGAYKRVMLAGDAPALELLNTGTLSPKLLAQPTFPLRLRLHHTDIYRFGDADPFGGSIADFISCFSSTDTYWRIPLAEEILPLRPSCLSAAFGRNQMKTALSQRIK